MNNYATAIHWAQIRGAFGLEEGMGEGDKEIGFPRHLNLYNE